MNDKWKSAFDQIHAEDKLKEHTKKYLSQKVCRRKTTSLPAWTRFAAAAACLILLLTGGTWIFLTPTAYISIDINPSLELGINRFDRIVSVESYNEDGESLAGSLDLTFMNYDDALEQLLSAPDMEAYLSQDAIMSLTVAGDDETQYREIYETVESCASSHKNIRCHSGSTAEMQEAHNAGVSFGKYRAYLILRELDPSVTLDDVRDLTMREIYNLIDSRSEGGAGDNTEDNTEDNAGHSAGHGRGGCHHGE